jgi:hypothetical protein
MVTDFRVVEVMFPNKFKFLQVKQKDPLYQKGKGHISESVFISPERKEILLNDYSDCWQAKNPYNISLCFFIKPQQSITRWKDTASLCLGRVRFMKKMVKNTKPITIWVWPTPWNKQYPQPHKAFNEDDINSGSTTLFLSGPLSKDNGEICLWRSQELLKVLVHELIHALRLDTHDRSPKEAYVELRAVLANVDLELLERKLPLSLRERMLDGERQFGLNQARKIAHIPPGSTNIKAYLGERNRLLWKVGKTKWEKMLNSEPMNEDELKGDLRFTITDHVLDKLNKPRLDVDGNVLTLRKNE